MRETPGHHDWLEQRLAEDDQWADGVGPGDAWTSRAFGELADTGHAEFVSLVDEARGAAPTVPDDEGPPPLAAAGSRSLGEVLDDRFDALVDAGRFTPAPLIDVLDEPDPGDVADPGDVLVGVALGAVDAVVPSGLADPFDVAPPVGTAEPGPVELGDDIVGVATELATPVTVPIEPADAMQPEPVVDVGLPEVRPAAVEFDEIDLTDDAPVETPLDDGVVDEGADLFDEDGGE